jgi:hypothetical protein
MHEMSYKYQRNPTYTVAGCHNKFSFIVAVFIHNHFESAIIVGQKQWCEFIIL